jgi:hypothetical protein
MVRFKKGSYAAKMFMAKLRGKRHEKRKTPTPKRKNIFHRVSKKIRRVLHRNVSDPVRVSKPRHHRSNKKHIRTQKGQPISLANAIVGIALTGIGYNTFLKKGNPHNPPPHNPPPYNPPPSTNPHLTNTQVITYSNGAQTYTINGTGFTPNSTAELQGHDPLSNPATSVINLNVDSNGDIQWVVNYSAGFSITQNDTVTFIARDNSSQTMSNLLSVFVPAAVPPSGLLSPKLLVNGSTSASFPTSESTLNLGITFTGSGFMPNSQITIYGNRNSSTAGSTIISDSNGNFSFTSNEEGAPAGNQYANTIGTFYAVDTKGNESNNVTINFNNF